MDITVKRANVLLTVPEDQKSEYLAKGFDVVDDRGRVVEHTTPSDVNTLKRAYIDHLKEIEKMKKEISELKSQLKAAKKKKNKLVD